MVFIDYITLLLINMTAGFVLLAAAGIWGLTAFLGYWDHMARFADWVPVVHIGGAK